MKRWEVQTSGRLPGKRRFWTREGAYRWMVRNLPGSTSVKDSRIQLQHMARMYYVKGKNFEQWGTNYRWALIRRIR